MKGTLDKVNINEIIDIDNHIAFLDRIMDTYQFNPDVSNRLLNDLAFIKRKKNDQNLYLSIIGEFSSGKSTFINALIRDDILESDIIQGTTVSSTVIKYGSKLDVIIKYKDGRTASYFNFKKKSIVLLKKLLMFITFRYSKEKQIIKSQIKNYIKEITTNAAIAEKISEVIIIHPAEILKLGIVIIDTPGTNSLERWHEEITKTAIHDLSDVSLILTNASQPLPDSLNEFIKQNLSGILSRCVFVVTKMDTIRAKERERQLSFVSQKINNTFDIESPDVYPYTPLYVLNESNMVSKDSNLSNKDDYNELVNQSYDTEKLIYNKLSEKRVIIQTQKLLHIMDEVYDYISNELYIASEEAKKDHYTLVKSTKRNLREYIPENDNKYKNLFLSESQNIKQVILNDLYLYFDNKRADIRKCFNTYDKRIALDKYMRKLRKTFSDFSDINITESRIMYSKFYHVMNEMLKSFCDEFVSMYGQLDILPFPDVDVKLKKIRKIRFPFVHHPRKSWILTVLSKNAFNVYKSEYNFNLTKSLDGYFQRIADAVTEDIDYCISSSCNKMSLYITSYLKTYLKTTDKMITQDNIKKMQLMKDITSLQSELGEIKNRKIAIESIKTKFGNV